MTRKTRHLSTTEKRVKNVLMRPLTVALLLGLAACSHHNKDDFASIGGHWAGSLRAGDKVGLYQTGLDLNQYDKAVAGTLSYNGGARNLQVSGEVEYASANLALSEAGCAGQPVPMWVKVGPEGLTVGFHGDTGCGLVSASGLLAR
jgi:hypothetical protein